MSKFAMKAVVKSANESNYKNLVLLLCKEDMFRSNVFRLSMNDKFDIIFFSTLLIKLNELF